MKFNETKATQVTAHLLNLRGGKMSYLKLIKLIYLADRTSLLRWGRPITMDRYYSMDRGPVVSQILNLITDGDTPGNPTTWVEHISAPSNYEIELINDPGRDELSEIEILILDEIFGEHGGKSRWELVDFTHELPEWKNPQGSAIPIEIRDILSLSGKTEFEIKAIEDDLSENSALDYILNR